MTEKTKSDKKRFFYNVIFIHDYPDKKINKYQYYLQNKI